MTPDEEMRRLAREAPKRPWSLRRINDGDHPFAIISPNGPHGDVILLGNIDEATACIIASLEAQLAEAREGLKPFMDALDNIPDDIPDDKYSHDCEIYIRLYDLRRADRILSTPSPDYAKSIRDKALDEAMEAVARSAWKHDGDDAYSKGMDAGASHQVKACYDAILSLKDKSP